MKNSTREKKIWWHRNKKGVRYWLQSGCYHKVINWKDLLFGKQTYTQDEVFTQELTLNLPEGDFDVILKAIECKRTRKRLLKPRRESRFEITPKIVESELKQKENPWKLENYDLQFIDVVASTIEEALEKTIQIITDQNKK